MKIKVLSILIFLAVLLIPVKAETVLATTKVTFADTILAKVISAIYGYPQVIVDKNNVSNETLGLLKELNATNIIIIGGPAVVSYKVESELENLGYNVIRIWGVTRYETSALVAKYFWNTTDEAVILTRELTSENNNVVKLTIVRDAVNLAIDKKIPILITPTYGLEKNVIDALLSLGVKKVYIFSLARNLTNLTEDLRALNISYEIERSYVPSNCTPIKIAVPMNLSWREVPSIFIYGRCVEIVPIGGNVTPEYLRKMNVSMALFNVSAIAKFKRMVVRQIIEKAKRIEKREMEMLSRMLENRIQDMLADIEERINEVPQYKYCYNEVLSYLNKNETYKAFRIALECLGKINEYRWKERIYVRDLEIRNLSRVINRIRENYISLCKRLLNETNMTSKDLMELCIRQKLPDLWRIRLTLWRMIRRRMNHTNTTYCVQVVTCACGPSGKCGVFPTPCDVPPSWKKVPCSKIIEIKKGKIVNSGEGK